jgi:hypothetical protein
MGSFGGLRCGRDTEPAVGDQYSGPNPFDGQLHRVTITLDDSEAASDTLSVAEALRQQ